MSSHVGERSHEQARGRLPGRRPEEIEATPVAVGESPARAQRRVAQAEATVVVAVLGSMTAIDHVPCVVIGVVYECDKVAQMRVIVGVCRDRHSRILRTPVVCTRSTFAALVMSLPPLLLADCVCNAAGVATGIAPRRAHGQVLRYLAVVLIDVRRALLHPRQLVDHVDAIARPRQVDRFERAHIFFHRVQGYDCPSELCHHSRDVG